MRIKLLLFFLIFITHASFYNGGDGWNQRVRYDVIHAFVEPNTQDSYTFHINHFITNPKENMNTGDWSKSGDHYYSSKAPGSSILAIPLYFFIYYFEKFLQIPLQLKFWQTFNEYLINLFVSIFFTSVACLIFYELMKDKTNNPLLYTCILAFGTLAFPFDTQLWGHTTAMAFIIFGYYYLLKKTNQTMLPAGFFLGLATLTEYSAGISLMIAFLSLFFFKENCVKKIFYFALGALPGVATLLIYQKICFGGYLNPAIRFANPIFLEQERSWGIFGNFSLSVFLKLLFSPYRGMFLYSPIFLFCIPGSISLYRFKKKRLFYLCLANILACLIEISCYNTWDGGLSSGPRFLIISLPFWVMFLPELKSLSKNYQKLFLILTGISIFNMVVISSTTPMVEAPMVGGHFRNPLYGTLYRSFFSGHLGTHLGTWIGLHGPISLLPLLLVNSMILYQILHYLRIRKC